MRVHVAQEDKPRLRFLRKLLDFRLRNVVEPLGLGRGAARAIAAPSGIVEVAVEAARRGIAAEPDAERVVAVLAQHFG